MMNDFEFERETSDESMEDLVHRVHDAMRREMHAFFAVLDDKKELRLIDAKEFDVEMFDGHVLEAMSFNRALSDTEHELLIIHLAERYNALTWRMRARRVWLRIKRRFER